MKLTKPKFKRPCTIGGSHPHKEWWRLLCATRGIDPMTRCERYATLANGPFPFGRVGLR